MCDKHSTGNLCPPTHTHAASPDEPNVQSVPMGTLDADDLGMSKTQAPLLKALVSELQTFLGTDKKRSYVETPASLLAAVLTLEGLDITTVPRVVAVAKFVHLFLDTPRGPLRRAYRNLLFQVRSHRCIPPFLAAADPFVDRPYPRMRR